MKDSSSYGPGLYWDPKYTVYALEAGPVGNDRYGLPMPYKGYSPFARDNEMVRYTFDSLSQRQPVSGDSDGIDGIFADRMGLIRSKIEMVLLQLSQRRDIHQKVIYEITQDDVKADNLLIQMGPAAYAINKERLSIEKMKFDLEKQKRMEEVGYFKDTAFLNKDLKESLIEYIGETQKSSLITDMEV